MFHFFAHTFFTYSIIEMDRVEIFIATTILALTSAIATGYIDMSFLHMNPVMIVLLVIIALAVFSVIPVVGFALFLLIAVLAFKHNVDFTLRRVMQVNNVYGSQSIPEQTIGTPTPYSNASTEPRVYNEFTETNALNPVIGPVYEPFEPAPFGDEAGSPVDGLYPLKDQVSDESPNVEKYIYYPDASTGDNTFERMGPNIDEKMEVFAY